MFVLSSYIKIFGFTDIVEGKESTCNAADLARFLGWEHPLEEDMANHSNFLPGKSEDISLVGYSPWSRKESDITEQLSTAH